MKNKLINLILILNVLLTTNVNGQSVFRNNPTLGIDTSRMYPYYRSCDKKQMKLLKASDSLLLKMELKKSLKVLRKLERKNPGTYLYKKIADINILNKNYKAAEKYYNKAIKLDKQYAVAYKGKIILYQILKDTEAERRTLQEMRNIFSDDVSVLFNMIAFHKCY